MSGVIASKYIAAIIQAFDESEMAGLLDSLEILSSSFSDEKFNEIINSPLVDRESKEKLMLSVLDNSSDKFNNLLKILSENSRLSVIPQIYEGLKATISADRNEYEGTIYSKDEISKEQISELENLLSKRFNSKISLKFVQSDYSGVKIDLEGLGSEISFSLDRLKHGISEYVLKAI